MTQKATRRTVLAGSAAVVASGAFGPGSPAFAGGGGNTAKPTVVLVHGAFADASGWNEVTRRLLGSGYPVLAPANPLRGLASDAAYLASILATISGPIVLVGHSYGGMVITNAGADNPSVRALVYVAAFAPDQHETVQSLQTRFPGKLSPQALDFRPYALPDGTASVDGYVKAALFRDIFAGDLPRSTTDVMAATQRPGDVHTLDEPSGVPAWRRVPSWYLIARDDNLIPVAGQRFMAQRANASIMEVRASHVVMMSQPRATAELIARAAKH